MRTKLSRITKNHAEHSYIWDMLETSGVCGSQRQLAPIPDITRFGVLVLGAREVSQNLPTASLHVDHIRTCNLPFLRVPEGPLLKHDIYIHVWV